MASGSTKAAQLSYLDTLDASSRTRYLKKIDVIGGQDPYKLGSDKVSADAKTLPAISYPDIVNYLVYSPSPYTLEDLKCYKGLEAYNQFVSGWVRDVRSTVINGFHVVLGRVSKIILKQLVIAWNNAWRTVASCRTKHISQIPDIFLKNSQKGDTI